MCRAATKMVVGWSVSCYFHIMQIEICKLLPRTADSFITSLVLNWSLELNCMFFNAFATFKYIYIILNSPNAFFDVWSKRRAFLINIIPISTIVEEVHTYTNLLFVSFDIVFILIFRENDLHWSINMIWILGLIQIYCIYTKSNFTQNRRSKSDLPKMSSIVVCITTSKT